MPRKYWTPDEQQQLRDCYADTDNQVLARRFSCSVNALYYCAGRLGLRKSAAFISQQVKARPLHPNAVAAQFKKGSVPANKGRHMSEFCTPEAIQTMSRTWFRPGNRPHNTRPVGYESVRSDGYVYIKVEGSRCMLPKHRWLWQQHHGPVPPGHNVAFADGNRLNCSLSNLILITDAQKALRNNKRTKNNFKPCTTMTLQQAFTQWAALPENTALAAKSRTPVQNVLLKDYGTRDVREFNAGLVQKLMESSSACQEFKTKAASVLVHVLKWAALWRQACNVPDFDYSIANTDKDEQEVLAVLDQPASPGPVSAPSPVVTPTPEPQPAKPKKKPGPKPKAKKEPASKKSPATLILDAISSVECADSVQPAAAPLSSFTDHQLIDELRTRGWRGGLTLEVKVSL